MHSNYIRTVTDLSILGCPVVITLKTRKFFCRNPGCLKKTFAEQPGDEIFRYRRRTRRCEMAVIQHGLKTFSNSPVNELRFFANGIRMDLKAVKNAISMDASNGIVEGYVNKLKAVKRIMYGRASIQLLKRKMVFRYLCFN